MTIGVSIIIPTYNRAALLRDALASAQALRVPTEWKAEIIVVDNNSTDETANVTNESANQGPISIRRVVETKQGLNHGRNRGLREASYDHVIYFDDDAEVDPGWLEAYVEALRELNADCVVGPVYPRFEGENPPWVNSRVLASVTSAYSRKDCGLTLLESESAHELPGCNFGVRRNVALQIGGFHPMLDRNGYGMLAGGDWEFGERLVRNKKRVVYMPDCSVDHLISRAKVSKKGLRRRWAGMGATQRALERLRGEELSLDQGLRFFFRMNKYFFRSLKGRMLRTSAIAFQWELETIRVLSYLVFNPRRIKPFRSENEARLDRMIEANGR